MSVEVALIVWLVSQTLMVAWLNSNVTRLFTIVHKRIKPPKNRRCLWPDSLSLGHRDIGHAPAILAMAIIATFRLR